MAALRLAMPPATEEPLRFVHEADERTTTGKLIEPDEAKIRNSWSA